MFLFYRLLLAHIIADFPLQTDQIFKIKMNTQWGVILHTLIVLIFSTLFTFPYLEDPSVVIILLVIFLSHTIIDKIKLEYSKKTNNIDIKIFLIDQGLHIFIIAILTFSFREKIAMTYPFENVFMIYLLHLYNNDILFIKLIGYISSIYFIPIFIMFVIAEKASYQKRFNNPETYKKEIPLSKNMDRLYRLSLTLFAQYLASRYLIIIFILFVLISIIIYKCKTERIRDIFNLASISNSVLALLIGMLLKYA